MSSPEYSRVSVQVPPGSIGLQIARSESASHGIHPKQVTVTGIMPKSAAEGKFLLGDCLVEIQGVSTVDQNISFVMGILAGTSQMPSRTITVLRQTKKENTETPLQRLPAAGVAPNGTHAHAVAATATNTALARAAVPMAASNKENASENALVNSATGKSNAWMGFKLPPPSFTSQEQTTISSVAVIPSKKRPPASASNQNKRGRPTNVHLQQRRQIVPPLPAVIPEPGMVCLDAVFYCTKNNETLAQVAEKLGSPMRDIANLPANTVRYGLELKGNSIFKPYTLLCIPPKRSPWKMKQLMKSEVDECMAVLELDECIDCGIASRPEAILLCDGCNGTHHVECVGLTQVPAGDWFCVSCRNILLARKEFGDVGRQPFRLPRVPPLSDEQNSAAVAMRLRLNDYLKNRRGRDLQMTEDASIASKTNLQELLRDLQNEIARLQASVKEWTTQQQTALRASMDQHNIADYKLSGGETINFIEFIENGIVVRLNESQEFHRNPNSARQRMRTPSARWTRARDLVTQVNLCPELARCNRHLQQAQTQLQSTHQNLSETKIELLEIDVTKAAAQKKIRLEYASLLNEPLLECETKTEYRNRGNPPRLMGQITVQNDQDAIALMMLQEPDELIVLVEHDDTSRSASTRWERIEPKVGTQYSVFGRADLFDKTRDDEMPLGSNGLRGAQRKLFDLLLAHSANGHMVVSRPHTPPTVRSRTNGVDNSHLRCFNISELVQDCNMDLDIPKEPTPESMLANGLVLYDFQQAALRWMLDKENEPTGLGTAGEFWWRLRFFDPSNEYSSDYFYCTLTGAFHLDIFDYKADVAQTDASTNRFSMPTSYCLGLEQGLGKTAISIALIIANPPPLHRRILQREHLWSLENKKVVEHNDYTSPPTFGTTDANTKFNRLSNGTLVIVPMTLLAQWQTEIEHFAPQLSVMVVHSAENPSAQAIASADVVLASSNIFQHNPRVHAASILRCIKRIHFHRILVDECHQWKNNSSLANVVGTISATHRASITGTPIGTQLSDLQGQMRYLRLHPFHRTEFFKYALNDPYAEHDAESLRVLRGLLSHIVCRYSKEQTHSNGRAMITLPDRKIETVFLKFGSEHERKFYDFIEAKNRTLLHDLKQDARVSVNSSLFKLNALLLACRQACGHVSIVDVASIHQQLRQRDDGMWGTRATPELSEGEKLSRAGLMQIAVSKARPLAKQLMVDTIAQCQTKDFLLECSVCLEATAEVDLAIPACAHPLCSECILGLLVARGERREPTGKCPTCRDTILRSEITFLNATDAGASAGSNENDSADTGETCSPTEESGLKKDDGLLEAKTLPSFNLETTEVQATVSGADSQRTGGIAMSREDLKQATIEKQALLPSLSGPFLSSFLQAESSIGSKVSQLLQEIQKMIAKDSTSKCLVFSQFNEVLDIAEKELTLRGIESVKIVGYCSQHARADALLEFASKPNKKVFLLGMRVGAVGLTLTSADHCFIMDVTQNSASEEQAIDRIHRIGQTKPVIVKRFVMQGTVEERLFSVRRKLQVDRLSTSTGICGASALDNETTTARLWNDDEATNQRIAFLEKIIGGASLKRG